MGQVPALQPELPEQKPDETKQREPLRSTASCITHSFFSLPLLPYSIKNESRHFSVYFRLIRYSRLFCSYFNLISNSGKESPSVLFIPVFPAEGGEELIQVFLVVGGCGRVAPDQGRDIAISRPDTLGLGGRALNPLDLRPFVLGRRRGRKGLTRALVRAGSSPLP